MCGIVAMYASGIGPRGRPGAGHQSPDPPRPGRSADLVWPPTIASAWATPG